MGENKDMELVLVTSIVKYKYHRLTWTNDDTNGNDKKTNWTQKSQYVTVKVKEHMKLDTLNDTSLTINR
jgi:hypothetical protein